MAFQFKVSALASKKAFLTHSAEMWQSHAKGYTRGQFAFCLFNTHYTVILALKKSGGVKKRRFVGEEGTLCQSFTSWEAPELLSRPIILKTCYAP